MLRLLTAVVLAWVATALPASARVLLDWRQGGAAIVIQGTIADETYFEIARADYLIDTHGGAVLAWVLDSPGGSVLDAIEIANEVQHSGAGVLVMRGAQCASACFLLLAAAREKLIAPDSLVAVHSATTEGAGEDAGAAKATVEMARLLAKYGVPAAIIGEMVETTPQGAAVLTPAQLATLPGTRIVAGVPVQLILQHASPIDLGHAGEMAGWAIAAGIWHRDLVCRFPDRVFRVGCIVGYSRTVRRTR